MAWLGSTKKFQLKHRWILVKLRQEVVNIWIFVFLAKQNISNDWEPKNSAEKPVKLASTLSLFLSAALKLLLGFSQQLQKRTKIQMFSTPCQTKCRSIWGTSDQLFVFIRLCLPVETVLAKKYAIYLRSLDLLLIFYCQNSLNLLEVQSFSS